MRQIVMIVIWSLALQVVACGQVPETNAKANNVTDKPESLIKEAPQFIPEANAKANNLQDKPHKLGIIESFENGKRTYYDLSHNKIKEVQGINNYHPLSVLYSMKLRESTGSTDESYDVSDIKKIDLKRLLENTVKLKGFSLEKISTLFITGDRGPNPNVSVYCVLFRDKKGEILADKSIIEYVDNVSSSVKYIETSRRLYDIGLSVDEDYIFGTYLTESEDEGIESNIDGILIYSLANAKPWLEIDFRTLLSTHIAYVNQSFYLDNNFYYAEISDFSPNKDENAIRVTKKIIVDVSHKILHEKVTYGRELDAYGIEIKDGSIYYDFMRTPDYSENINLVFKQFKM